MAKLVISKRVIFPEGEQRRFIEKLLKKLSFKEMAKFCNLSERAIRDWRCEKFSADYLSLCKICKKTNIPFPRKAVLKDRYWYTAKGSSVGGRAVFKKYGRIGGDPDARKKKWYGWWEKEGKYKKHPIIGISKPIKRPRFSIELAEFVGIILGDGGVTQRQVTVSFCYKDEKEYSKFVIDLIKELFSVPVGIYYDKKYSAFNAVVSRTELIRFCVEKLGLKQGNKIKQQVDIPDWIKRNKRYSIACVRGLIDTDGCVFTHCYKSGGKWYRYKKISFTSYSEPLRQSVFNILRDIGLNPRLGQRQDVWLDSQKDVKKYLKIVNFHNQKHLLRYSK